MRKRDEKTFQITDSQLFTMMIGVLVGVGVTSLPREAAEVAGRDGWISIITATILGIMYLYICISYCKLFPNLSLAESMQIVLGRYLGIFLTIIYALYTFATAAVIMRFFLESNYVYFNLYYSMLLPFGVTAFILVYMGRCGLATLARVSEVVFIFSFAFVVLFFFPDKGANFLSLRPVSQLGAMPIIESIPTTALAFLGLEVILVFYPFLEKKETAFRVSAMATALTGIFYTGVFIGTITILGLEATKIFIWPFMEYLKLISFQIVERIDNMFVYLWTAKVFMVTTIQYFAGTFSLSMLTKRKYHDIWVLVCWPVFYIIGCLPQNLVMVTEFTSFVSKYGGLFVFVLPIVLLTVAKIRGLNYAKSKK
ncbi:endospore germination permease [Alkalicella caledoniensis]|uniref:Endospore germination permease n=1 Tax=Alkalicella caledoniensis TaxID=2731377 RepID=A0A7G9W740_ALKCA|nr:endospore germination permease [Alkalicella caledoniensis]QNO14502.1 endospore germination permease [Alkalicella caledoniensis]